MRTLLIPLFSALALQAGSTVAAELDAKPAFTATREAGTSFVQFSRFQGRFTDTLLFAHDQRQALYRFDATSGQFLGMVTDSPDGKGAAILATASAVTNAELWLGDETGKLSVLKLPEAAPLQSLSPEGLGTPVALLVRYADEQNRVVYALSKADEGLYLHRIAVSVVPGSMGQGISGASVAGQSKLKLDTDADGGQIFADIERGQIVVAVGDQLSVYDYDLAPVEQPIVAEKAAGKIQGLGLLSCPNSLDKGYWLVAQSSGKKTHLRFYDRVSAALRAELDTTAIDGPVLLDTQAVALFPTGALYGAKGNKVLGFAWDQIAKAAGLRAACF